MHSQEDLERIKEIWEEVERAKSPDERIEVLLRTVQVSEILNYDYFVDELWGYDPEKMPMLGYLGLAITGEAGEVADKIKKIYREAGGEASTKVSLELAKELGDLLYYVVKMAHVLGYSLEEVVRINRKKLEDRKNRGKLVGEGDNR